MLADEHGIRTVEFREDVLPFPSRVRLHGFRMGHPIIIIVVGSLWA